MQKCDFNDKSFDDLTLDEKVKFFTELNKAWDKNDPNDVMSKEGQDQLESIVVSEK